jgi:hypothetical protein
MKSLAFEADKGYTDNNDSLKALLASLLSAESFLDRAVPPERAKK